MQMYKVTFQTHYPDLIDVGTCVVCANSSEAAAELIREHLRLPVSTTVFEASRIKPSIYTLNRKEVVKHANAHHNAKSQDSDPAIYILSASCSLKAYSEASAWRRFADALIERVSASKAIIDKTGIRDLEMSCERRELSPRSPAVERQALYKSPQFFAGGAARGK